jgi:hypothetical protein
VSQSPTVSPNEIDAPSPRALNPLRNPAYPQRSHLHERAHWEAVLRQCEERIAQAQSKLSASSDGPDRERLERLHAQMLGARDQVADAVRRLPMETGDLYEEDKERVAQAVAALDRVVERWDGQKG